MRTVLGPARPRQRFPRRRYLGQLLELDRVLEQWQHTYALEGVDNRVDILAAVRTHLAHAIEEYMYLKS